MSKYKTDSFLIQSIVFLSFLGSYIFVLLALNAGFAGITRQITIPVRVFLGMCCLLLFFKNIKIHRGFLNVFFVFSFFYSARIFYEIISNQYIYIPINDLIFYFISFCFIPFISLSKIDFSRIKLNEVFNVFLVSAGIFSLLVIKLYGRFIGSVTRLSSNRVGEDVASPLTLSYCATLIIGVVLIYLIYNKTTKLKKIACYLVIILAIIPFFLGASRGSIFALFFPFIIMLSTKLTPKNIIKYFLLLCILTIALFYLDNYLGSGLIDRFIGTSEAIESGSSSANRMDIWKRSINQFLAHPIFGDKINTDYYNHYPHNIYLEVLQSVGLIGFIPFIILVIKGISVSRWIFKYSPAYSWVAVFFLQAMMRHMFSSALYTSVWFWTSLAMLLSFSVYLKNVIHYEK